MILEIIAAVILVEAVTNILSKSTLFAPLREFFFNRRANEFCRFIHNLIDCPYCTSVWVSSFVVGMLYWYMNSMPSILALFFMALVLHRLSNVLHFIIDRVDENHNLFIETDTENDK
jgi:hypothetical protein